MTVVYTVQFRLSHHCYSYHTVSFIF